MVFHLKPIHGDTVAVPQLVFSKLGTADEANMRVALYLLATGVCDAEQIARDLKLRSKQTAETALLWWAGAGLLERTDTPDGAEVAAATPAPAMTWQEIANASRTDPMIASLIECVQSSFGCSLSHGNLQKLVSFYLQDGFLPEVIMLCAAYIGSKENQKKTISNLQHSLKAWQTDGVETGEDADRYLQLLAQREEREAFVASLLALEASEMTLGARKAIVRWYETYGFGDEMISESVLHAGAKKDIWYLNGILKSWHTKGLRTVHDVRGGGAVTGGESRNLRVEREEIGESGFLQGKRSRPRRLKRKD